LDTNGIISNSIFLLSSFGVKKTPMLLDFSKPQLRPTFRVT